MDKAMKAKDFKPCAFCGKGVMHAGVPLFYRIHVERMGVDGGAVQRAAAMEQYMGGHVALARVFEDPEIAKPITPGTTVLVCETCSTEPRMVAMLTEREPHTEERETAAGE